jgi:hypothetical protein
MTLYGPRKPLRHQEDPRLQESTDWDADQWLAAARMGPLDSSLVTLSEGRLLYQLHLTGDKQRVVWKLFVGQACYLPRSGKGPENYQSQFHLWRKASQSANHTHSELLEEAHYYLCQAIQAEVREGLQPARGIPETLADLRREILKRIPKQGEPQFQQESPRFYHVL